MSINQRIYETLNLSSLEAASVTGYGDAKGIEYRRTLIKDFLKNNEWNEESFRRWVSSEKELPSKTAQLKQLITAGIQAAKTQIKPVSAIERLNRLFICDSCPYLRRIDNRCAKCGCFTSYKSRLESWHCPIDKW